MYQLQFCGARADIPITSHDALHACVPRSTWTFVIGYLLTLCVCAHLYHTMRMHYHTPIYIIHNFQSQDTTQLSAPAHYTILGEWLCMQLNNTDATRMTPPAITLHHLHLALVYTPTDSMSQFRPAQIHL